MNIQTIAVLVLAIMLPLAGCGSSGGDGGGTPPSSPPPADWAISLDSHTTAPLPRTLLGQYDLMGAHFNYSNVPNLIREMGVEGSAASLPANVFSGVGFSEWRVGVGLSHPGALLLPMLTDGTPCNLAGFPPQALAPSGWTDVQLMQSRDWFTDNGAPVTLAMTNDDSRYSLGYVRSVIDTATSFGVRPFLNIDYMPRALSMNRTPLRSTAIVPDACEWPLTNAVSNAPPADPDVYAAAAVGLVKRIVEGSGSEQGRSLAYVELANEPELPYFWDRRFEPGGGLDRFYGMAIRTLFLLDAYRRIASNTTARQLRFGLGSFAAAETAVATLAAFDANPVSGALVPLDFISFHSYHNDPIRIVADIRAVGAARSATRNYQNVELILAEWGPSLSDMSARSATSMDFPLLVSSVISAGAAAGLSHAHQSVFWAYYDALEPNWGLLSHSVQPKPLYWAYALMARVIGGNRNSGAERLTVSSAQSGELDNGVGTVLASRDTTGKVRVLITNRSNLGRSVRIDLDRQTRTPSLALVLDAPTLRPRPVASQSVTTVPPRSVVLIEL